MDNSFLSALIRWPNFRHTSLSLLLALLFSVPLHAQIEFDGLENTGSPTRCLPPGEASTYGDGDGFHGRRTASGEIYDQWKMTTAHRTLPFGTRLRVTRPDNGRSVVVRVTDRGPYVDGRILDLSTAAAEQLGMRRSVAKVKACFLTR